MEKTMGMIEIAPKIPSSKPESSDPKKYYLQKMLYEISPSNFLKYFIKILHANYKENLVNVQLFDNF
jgi:hypothetical protein